MRAQAACTECKSVTPGLRENCENLVLQQHFACVVALLGTYWHTLYYTAYTRDI